MKSKADSRVTKVFEINGKQVGYEIVEADGSIIKIAKLHMPDAIKNGYKFVNATVSSNGVVRVSKDVPRVNWTAPQDLKIETINGFRRDCIKAVRLIAPSNESYTIALRKNPTHIKADTSAIKSEIISAHGANTTDDDDKVLTDNVKNFAESNDLKRFQIVDNDIIIGRSLKSSLREGLLMSYDIDNLEQVLGAVKVKYDYFMSWLAKVDSVSWGSYFYTHACPITCISVSENTNTVEDFNAGDCSDTIVGLSCNSALSGLCDNLEEDNGNFTLICNDATLYKILVDYYKELFTILGFCI